MSRRRVFCSCCQLLAGAGGPAAFVASLYQAEERAQLGLVSKSAARAEFISRAAAATAAAAFSFHVHATLRANIFRGSGGERETHTRRRGGGTPSRGRIFPCERLALNIFCISFMRSRETMHVHKFMLHRSVRNMYLCEFEHIANTFGYIFMLIFSYEKVD